MDAAQMLVKQTPERIGAVLAELPQILVDRIKAYLPPELQLQASESLAEVIENTVGEMMDPALAVLPETTTVQEAIAFLRNHQTPQQITYLYVTDAEAKLIGLIVIRDLILAEPNQTLTDVMLPDGSVYFRMSAPLDGAWYTVPLPWLTSQAMPEQEDPGTADLRRVAVPSVVVSNTLMLIP